MEHARDCSKEGSSEQGPCMKEKGSCKVSLAHAYISARNYCKINSKTFFHVPLTAVIVL